MWPTPDLPDLAHPASSHKRTERSPGRAARVAQNGTSVCSDELPDPLPASEKRVEFVDVCGMLNRASTAVECGGGPGRFRRLTLLFGRTYTDPRPNCRYAS